MERVRDAVEMVDLVGTRTELRRAGVNRYEGLCPFHDERTPSFGIDPAQKLFYCFGCGEGGDAFKFVQLTEGLDFKGALEYLADRYGVQLEPVEEDPATAERRRERERLLELLERTATFYVRYLWDSGEAAPAREYLASRGLDEAVLREFRVGYAPSAYDTLLHAVRRAGFSNREVYDAGLAQRAKGEGMLYDRFRRRIMFPLCDLRGRVLGFGARALGADQKPKYLNSSDNARLPQGPQPLRRGHRARGGDEGGQRDRRRGLHRRDRDAPGRPAQHGRADGDRAHRGAGRRARRGSRRGCSWRSTPTARGRRRCSAPRGSRRGGGSSCGSSRCRRARTRPTSSRPRARGRCSGSSTQSVPFVRFRVERELSTGDLGQRRGQGRGDRRAAPGVRADPAERAARGAGRAGRGPHGPRAGARRVVAGAGRAARRGARRARPRSGRRRSRRRWRWPGSRRRFRRRTRVGRRARPARRARRRRPLGGARAVRVPRRRGARRARVPRPMPRGAVGREARARGARPRDGVHERADPPRRRAPARPPRRARPGDRPGGRAARAA